MKNSDAPNPYATSDNPRLPSICSFAKLIFERSIYATRYSRPSKGMSRKPSRLMRRDSSIAEVTVFTVSPGSGCMRAGLVVQVFVATRALLLLRFAPRLVGSQRFLVRRIRAAQRTAFGDALLD